MGSTEVVTIEDEPSQGEKNLERNHKVKVVAKRTPSSLKGRPSMEQIPRWLQKEMVRNKKHRFNADEEDMIELIKVLRKPEFPLKEARVLTFINSD